MTNEPVSLPTRVLPRCAPLLHIGRHERSDEVICLMPVAMQA
jgi:hypothetical protein